MASSRFTQTVRLNRRFVEDGVAVWKEAWIEVALEIDVTALAHMLGDRAVRSKGKYSTALHGAVKARTPRLIDWKVTR